MKGNIFWWRLEGTGSDGQYVSPIVVTGGQAALLEHGESNEMRKVNEAKCSIRQRPQHHKHSHSVQSHRSPEFYIEEKWQNHQERNENDQQKPGEEQLRRESKTLKSCLRLVLLDYDLWRDTFRTASKVKCEGWTREREKRKSSRVQDVSKIHGTYSSTSTITLWNWIPEQQLFALLSWSGTPSRVSVIWTPLAFTVPQQRKKP